MKIIQRLVNMPLILVLSIKIKGLEALAREANQQLIDACEIGCDHCDAGGNCKQVKECPVKRRARQLEAVSEAIADQAERKAKLWG